MPAAARREDIEEQIRLLQLEQVRELEKMAEVVKHERISLMFPDTGPLRRELYKTSIDWLNATAEFQELVLFGGNRCVGPATRIETPDGSVPILEFLGATSFDVLSWDGESQCVRPASGVFLKGIEPMFRFQVDTGGFFDCTRKHLVLTQYGWLSSEQLVWLLSGRHWSEITADYLASCGAGDSLCGQQLLLVAGSDLTQLPLPTDAQEPALLAGLRTGAAGHGYKHNPSWPVLDLRTIQDDPDLIAGLCERFSAPEQHSVAPAWSVIRPSFGRRGVALTLDPLSGDATELRLFEHEQASQILVGGNSILGFHPIGIQPVLDFTVEDTACYFAGGVVHHNTGKTETGAYAATLWATGEYPHWWKGKRFPGPTNGVVAGKNGKTVRDSVQVKLIGSPDREFGTGLIPLRCLVRDKCKKAHGTPELYETIVVRHVSGEESTINLKSYDQGRQAFEANLNFKILALYGRVVWGYHFKILLMSCWRVAGRRAALP